MTPDRKIKVIVCGTDICFKAIFDNMKMFASAITIYNCNTMLSICVCIITIEIEANIFML